MKIRKGQIAALERASLNTFEVELVGHIQGFAPRHAEVIGDTGVLEVVRLGITRAAGYGLTNRGPIRFYIEVMFMFGSDFDTDPWLPWAVQCLNDPLVCGQMERAEQLHAALVVYLEQVAGCRNAYSIEALRRINGARPEDYTVSAPDFEDFAVSRLNYAHPQRCAYLGEPSLRSLIRSGMKMAKEYSADNILEVGLFVALMFALGHGFDHDPLFPWISGALNDPHVTDSNRRVERLYTRAKTYLSHALAFLERR
jgi:hypothetical protein